jgi:glucose-1-phosphate cytidylyltransferase
MKVIIMAGGLGTRLSEETELKPKPMVEVGGKPIIWHIMNIYAHAGFKEFIVALGYKGEIIKDYFLKYFYIQNSFTVDLASNRITMHDKAKEAWTVHLVDTGVQTQTGGRLKRLAPWIGDETFMMTYGDGVARLDIRELAAFHKSHGKLATVTGVRPPSRFGGLVFDDTLVTEFLEKPQIGEGWINGGFFVLEPKVLGYIADDATLFEKEPLERLARDRQLAAYKHGGFWQCMDTLRDVRLLNDLWDKGEAPWKIWK